VVRSATDFELRARIEREAFCLPFVLFQIVNRNILSLFGKNGLHYRKVYDILVIVGIKFTYRGRGASILAKDDTIE